MVGNHPILKIPVSFNEMRNVLLEAGEIETTRIEGHFKDMGDHLIHEDMIPEYFDYYVRRLKKTERAELMASLQRRDYE